MKKPNNSVRRIRDALKLVAATRPQGNYLRFVKELAITSFKSRSSPYALSDSPLKVKSEESCFCVAGLADARTLVSTFESSVKNKLYELLSSDDCLFLDVGANFGFWSIRAGARGARVIAIEPDERNLKLLRKNAELNRFEQTIQIFEGCVGQESERREFAREQYGRKSTLVDYQGGQQGTYDSTITIRCYTLDEVIGAVGTSNSSHMVLKIDVEGAEAEVIRGATRVIERFKPAIVFEALTHHAYTEVKAALQEVIPPFLTRAKSGAKRPLRASAWG